MQILDWTATGVYLNISFHGMYQYLASSVAQVVCHIGNSWRSHVLSVYAAVTLNGLRLFKLRVFYIARL